MYISHKFITEKADGLTKRESLKNISDLNNDIIVEYEKMDNINIVFNINNEDNIFENMNYLRSIHPFAPKINKFYFNETNLEDFVKLEKEAFSNYLDNGSGKLWWPKFVWIIDKRNNIDYLKSIADLRPLKIFKTDGYILYSEEPTQDIIKIIHLYIANCDFTFCPAVMLNGTWYTCHDADRNVYLDSLDYCFFVVFFSEKIYHIAITRRM